MLHEMLGVEWYKVHDEAERLEHAISEDVEQRLIDKLGAGKPCPHGNQINKSPDERRKSGLRLLWEASPGSVVRVESMDERDSKLLEYFDGLGIRPGTQVKVVSPNYDGTLGSFWVTSPPIWLKPPLERSGFQRMRHVPNAHANALTLRISAI